MELDQIRTCLTSAFAGVDVVEGGGTFFFFAHPYQGKPTDQRFNFATLVSDDDHDQVSQLSRAGVFRLNISVGRDTYRALFAKPPAFHSPTSEMGYDFTEMDKLLPHPVYAAMFWVCVLNPSTRTFERLKPLLEEAYQRAWHKF